MTLALWTFQPANTNPDAMPSLGYMESARESARSNYNPTASEKTRVFYVRNSEEEIFINALLGYSELNVTGTGITREIPDALPDNPLFCAYTAEAEPLGQAAVHILQGQWELSKVTAKYKPVPWAVLPDNQINGNEINRYTERTYEVQTEFVTVQGMMRFVRTQRILNRPPGKYITKLVKVMTWHDVPAKRPIAGTVQGGQYAMPNFTAVKACQGRVNSANFDAGQENHLPGTVLFLGCEPKLIMPRLGESLHHFDLVMKFLILDQGDSAVYPGTEVGHNFIFDQIGDPGSAITPDWDVITSTGGGGGQHLYDQADLNSLWTIG